MGATCDTGGVTHAPWFAPCHGSSVTAAQPQSHGVPASAVRLHVVTHTLTREHTRETMCTVGVVPWTCVRDVPLPIVCVDCVHGLHGVTRTTPHPWRAELVRGEGCRGRPLDMLSGCVSPLMRRTVTGCRYGHACVMYGTCVSVGVFRRPPSRLVGTVVASALSRE